MTGAQLWPMHEPCAHCLWFHLFGSVSSFSGDYSSDPEGDIGALLERKVGFTIKYDRDDPLDPRELSEMPDVRLWFVRLDVAYPWLPAVLDWRGGSWEDARPCLCRIK